MKRLMIRDLSLTEELRRAPMGAVRGGFCGTPVPEPVVTLPAFPAMPAMPGIPAIPALPVPPGLPGPGLPPAQPIPCYVGL
jgi:hypothetical protein